MGRRAHSGAKNGIPLQTSTTRSQSLSTRWYFSGARRNWVKLPPFLITWYERSPTGPPQSRVTSSPRAIMPSASRSTRISDPPALGLARSRHATNRMCRAGRVAEARGSGIGIGIGARLGGGGAGAPASGSTGAPTSGGAGALAPAVVGINGPAAVAVAADGLADSSFTRPRSTSGCDTAPELSLLAGNVYRTMEHKFW